MRSRNCLLTNRLSPPNRRTFRPCWLGVLLAVLALSAGCAYRLGPTNGTAAGARSVEVGVFQNHTSEPLLIPSLVTALRRQLQQDGTFRLETREEGDILVSGTLTEFKRTGLSFQPRDILTPVDYEVLITARIRAVERSSGKVILDKDVLGRTLVRLGSNQASAERQAIPLLAEDLARRTTSLLADGSW